MRATYPTAPIGGDQLGRPTARTDIKTEFAGQGGRGHAQVSFGFAQQITKPGSNIFHLTNNFASGAQFF